jgi:hypothetical protein
MKLKPGQVPQDLIPMDEHPLLTEECCIPTHGVEVFYNAALKLLRTRRPGMVLMGNPRTGKTYSAESFAKNHSSVVGKSIPVAHMDSWTEGPKTSATEARFFGCILRAFDYDTPFSGTAAVRLDRAVDLVLERVSASDDNRALLIVDEGHNLGKREYGYLMDYYNLVRKGGCRLKVMIVGQKKEMKQKIAAMKKYPQIRERFHTLTRVMPGVRNAAELRRILDCLDTTSTYPEKSNWTYTYFFVPKAHAAGLRLADVANELWLPLQSAFEWDGEVAVQTIFEIVTDLLVEASYSDSKDFDLSADLISSIINDLRPEVETGPEAANDPDADVEAA